MLPLVYRFSVTGAVRFKGVSIVGFLDIVVIEGNYLNGVSLWTDDGIVTTFLASGISSFIDLRRGVSDYLEVYLTVNCLETGNAS